MPLKFVGNQSLGHNKSVTDRWRERGENNILSFFESAGIDMKTVF
jgi:hypothetical protein